MTRAQIPTASPVDAPADAELLALELRPLIGFASLLVGDPDAGEMLALDALAGHRDGAGSERSAVSLRASVTRMARRMRGRRGAVRWDDPLLGVLLACPLAERAALICVAYERLVDAEVAAILGCGPEEVVPLVDRARARVAEGATGDPVSLDARLRAAMRTATEQLRMPADATAAVAARRDGRRRRLLLRLIAGVAALGVAGALLATRPNAPEPRAAPPAGLFQHPAAGYRLEVHPSWRAQPTLAARTGTGSVDPSRFGLATVDPLDEVAAFIPRRPRGPSALLRITVRSTLDYHADVENARQRLTLSRQPGTVLTAALDTVGGRPATRFRLDHPAEGPACPGCRSLVWVAHWTHGTTMSAWLVAFGPSANEELLGQGWQMIQSLEPADGPATVRYLPSSGSMTDAVSWDEHAEALMQFLDARVRGDGADGWLSEAAARAYDPLGLYGLRGYRVLDREDRSAGAAAFTVELRRDASPGALVERERILVGPGRTRFDTPWPMLVLDAETAA